MNATIRTLLASSTLALLLALSACSSSSGSSAPANPHTPATPTKPADNPDTPVTPVTPVNPDPDPVKPTPPDIKPIGPVYVPDPRLTLTPAQAVSVTTGLLGGELAWRLELQNNESNTAKNIHIAALTAPLSISSTTCGTELAGHSSCLIHVLYNGTTSSDSDNKTQDLSVTYGPDGITHTATQTINFGVNSDPKFEQASSQALLTTVGTTVSTNYLLTNNTPVAINDAQVHLQNPTTKALALTDGDLSINTNAEHACKNGTSLAKNASCTVQVDYRPLSAKKSTSALLFTDAEKSSISLPINADVTQGKIDHVHTAPLTTNAGTPANTIITVYPSNNTYPIEFSDAANAITQSNAASDWGNTLTYANGSFPGLSSAPEGSNIAPCTVGTAITAPCDIELKYDNNDVSTVEVPLDLHVQSSGDHKAQSSSITLKLATVNNDVTINPTSQEFVTDLGSESKAQTFSITNSGDYAIEGLKTSLSGPFITVDDPLNKKPCGTSLAAKQSCYIDVLFSAKEQTSARRVTGTLTVSTAGKSSAAISRLTGDINPATLRVTSSSSELDTNIGIPADITLAIKPDSDKTYPAILDTDDLSISSVGTALLRSLPSGFSVISDSCPHDGSTPLGMTGCAITLRYLSNTASGLTTQHLAVHYKSEDKVETTPVQFNTQVFSQTALGFQPNKVTLTHDSQDAILKFTNTLRQPLTGMHLALSDTRLLNIDAANTTCTDSLAASASCQYAIHYTPSVATATASASATLNVDQALQSSPSAVINMTNLAQITAPANVDIDTISGVSNKVKVTLSPVTDRSSPTLKAYDGSTNPIEGVPNTSDSLHYVGGSFPGIADSSDGSTLCSIGTPMSAPCSIWLEDTGPDATPSTKSYTLKIHYNNGQTDVITPLHVSTNTRQRIYALHSDSNIINDTYANKPTIAAQNYTALSTTSHSFAISSKRLYADGEVDGGEFVSTKEALLYTNKTPHTDRWNSALFNQDNDDTSSVLVATQGQMINLVGNTGNDYASLKTATANSWYKYAASATRHYKLNYADLNTSYAGEPAILLVSIVNTNQFELDALTYDGGTTIQHSVFHAGTPLALGKSAAIARLHALASADNYDYLATNFGLYQFNANDLSATPLRIEPSGDFNAVAANHDRVYVVLAGNNVLMHSSSDLSDSGSWKDIGAAFSQPVTELRVSKDYVYALSGGKLYYFPIGTDSGSWAEATNLGSNIEQFKIY